MRSIDPQTLNFHFQPFARNCSFSPNASAEALRILGIANHS